MDHFHAHVYYDSSNFDKAKRLVETAYKQLTEVTIGKMHEKPVGPHPVWSCQLLFDRGQLTNMLIWLLKNRDDLTIFIHPVTDNELLDHTDYAIWLGERYELNLEALK